MTERRDGDNPSDQREEGIRVGRLTDRERRRSFEEEDRRWSTGHQVRDWLVLVGLMAISVAWMLALALLEPGLSGTTGF